jgi:hypothetical protein
MEYDPLGLLIVVSASQFIIGDRFWPNAAKKASTLRRGLRHSKPPAASHDNESLAGSPTYSLWPNRENDCSRRHEVCRDTQAVDEILEELIDGQSRDSRLGGRVQDE